MGRPKIVDDIILITIDVKSQEKADEIVAFLKNILVIFPEVELESIDSAESSWVIDGG